MNSRIVFFKIYILYFYLFKTLHHFTIFYILTKNIWTREKCNGWWRITRYSEHDEIRQGYDDEYNVSCNGRKNL